VNHRERIMTALQRQEPDYVPFGIHFAPAKYEEFMTRTGETDSYEYFNLDYRHVSVAPPKTLPDFSRYFLGRVPDWPNMITHEFPLKPFRGSTSLFVMGEHNTAMNEWGEYRIYGEDRDYHRKIFPLNHPDCTVTDVERYPFPDLFAPYRYEGVEEEIRTLHQRDLAAVLSWEMTIFEKAWRISRHGRTNDGFRTQTRVSRVFIEPNSRTNRISSHALCRIRCGHRSVRR